MDTYRAGFIACISEVERFLSIPDLTLSNFAEYVERDLKLKLLRHLEACELEIEAKGNNNNEEKATTSKTKTQSSNNHKGTTETCKSTTTNTKARSSQKCKQEPPLVSADQPLDFSKATGNSSDKIKPEMPNYTINVPILDNQRPIYTHQAANLEDRTEAMTTLKKDQYILLFPKFLELNDSKFAAEYITPGLPNINNNGNSIMDILDNKKKSAGKRKTAVDREEPSKKMLTNVKDIKIEEDQFNLTEEFPTSFDNNDDIDEPLDVKVDNFDDPMWRPW